MARGPSSLATGPTAPFADFPKVQGTGGRAEDGLVVGFAGGWACVAPSLLWLSCPLPGATLQNTGSPPGRAQAWILAALHVPVLSDRPPRSQAGPLDVPVLLLPLLVVSGSLVLQPGLQDKEGRAATGCWGHPRGHDPHADPRQKHAQRACEAAGRLRLLALQNQVSGRAGGRVRGRGPAATFAHLTFCPALPGTRTCRGSPSADSPRRGKLGERTTRL